jgi:hypothetical protein
LGIVNQSLTTKTSIHAKRLRRNHDEPYFVHLPDRNAAMYTLNPGNALELVSQGWDYLRSTVYKGQWMPSNLSSPNPASSLLSFSDNFPKMRAQAVFLFSLSTLFSNAQETCDAGCQAAFKQFQGLEASSWVSKNVTLDTFYSTPSNITGAKPGDLLRWEDVPQNVVSRNFTIPGGMSLFRFLYMSEDIDRKPIPASAFVLLPEPTVQHYSLGPWNSWTYPQLCPFEPQRSVLRVAGPVYFGHSWICSHRS